MLPPSKLLQLLLLRALFFFLTLHFKVQSFELFEGGVRFERVDNQPFQFLSLLLDRRRLRSRLTQHLAAAQGQAMA